MKTICAIYLLSAAVTFCLGEQRAIGIQEAIRKLDERFTVALLRADPETLDAVLADDYIEIDAQGIVRHKSDVMATARARPSAPRSISVGPEIIVSDKIVRVHGDTAILTGVTTTKYQHMEYQSLPQPTQPPAPNANYQQRFMRVYSKLKGRWQLVASQTTGIANR